MEIGQTIPSVPVSTPSPAVQAPVAPAVSAAPSAAVAPAATPTPVVQSPAVQATPVAQPQLQQPTVNPQIQQAIAQAPNAQAMPNQAIPGEATTPNGQIATQQPAQAPMTYVRGEDGKVYMVVAKEIDNPQVLKSVPKKEPEPEAPKLSVHEQLLLKLSKVQDTFNSKEDQLFRAYEAYNYTRRFR
jgi:hypothetical protein